MTALAAILRGVAVRPPYMHAGQFNSLKELLENYRDLPQTGLTDELRHNHLSDEELYAIEVFLHSLTSLKN